MSFYGMRDYADDGLAQDIFSNTGTNFEGDGQCTRFRQRFYACLRESQEVDVLYDCRSRQMDFFECIYRTKQTIWYMREAIVTMRNRDSQRNWLRKYDEDFGHPPLLEAVDKCRKKLQVEGGPEVMHPTHFKDPEVW